MSGRRYPWYDTTCGILLALAGADIVDPIAGACELARRLQAPGPIRIAR